MGHGQELLIYKYFSNVKSDKRVFRNARVNYVFIDKLKELYLKYPQKLWIHGIDVELSLMPFVEELLETTKNITDERVRKYLDRLSDYETVDLITRKQQNHYRYKIERAIEKLDDYIIFTNSKDEKLKNIVHRGIASFYVCKKRTKPRVRESFLYESVQILLKKYPDDYFYLQMGLNHAFNETMNEKFKYLLGYKLQHAENSAIKNNVFSIGLAIVDGRSKYWKGNLNTIDYYPIVVDSTVCKQMFALKPAQPTYKIYKPTGENPFDLYLIALNFDAEITVIPQNYLHLLRTK